MKFNNLAFNDTAENKLRTPWLIFAATTLGACIVNIDVTIVNVALPFIAKHYTANVGKVQWIISSYVLATCILLPICGRLSDIYTKRFIYLLGFAIFTFGSALCGFATSLTMLILFRLVQGVGAAMIMSNNQALIVMNFPQNLQGRALSVNSMSASFGAIAGPAFGGFLLSILSWRSIFYINIPIGIIGCVVGYYVLPRNEKRLDHPLDIIGAIFFAAFISCVLFLFEQFGSGYWVNVKNLILLTIAVVAGWLFTSRQKEITHPLINLSLFKVATYLRGNIAAFIVFMAMGGNGVLLPFYLNDVLQLAPGVIGMLMFVGPCTMLVLAPLSGYLTDRFPQKIFVAVGLLLFAAGLIFQGSAGAHSSIRHVVIGQIIIGSGFAFFQPPNNVTLFKNFTTTNFGLVSSINALVRNMGRVFGVVIAVSVFTLLFTHMFSLYSLQQHTQQQHNIAFLQGFSVAYYCLAAFVLGALYVQLSKTKKIRGC